MLVLERKPGQKIIIQTSDGEIEIELLSWKRVHLGFTAPKAILIHRKEILDKEKVNV